MTITDGNTPLLVQDIFNMLDRSEDRASIELIELGVSIARLAIVDSLSLNALLNFHFEEEERANLATRAGSANPYNMLVAHIRHAE